MDFLRSLFVGVALLALGASQLAAQAVDSSKGIPPDPATAAPVDAETKVTAPDAAEGAAKAATEGDTTAPAAQNAPGAGAGAGANPNQEIIEEEEPRRGGRNFQEIVQIGTPVHIKEGETAKTVVVILQDATIDGDVTEDVVVVGGNATIRGDVGGDVVCVLGKLLVDTNAVIRGDAVGVGGGIERVEGGRVRGEAVSVPFPGMPEFAHQIPSWVGTMFRELVLKARPLSLRVGWVWWVFGALVAAHFLIALILPKAVRSATTILETRPAMALLVGLMALPLAAFFAVILAATGVGLVLWPFLLAALVFAAFLGKTSVAQYLGFTLGRQTNWSSASSPLLAILLGVVILTLLYLVWYLGILTWAVASAWGLGAALLALFGQFQRELPPPQYIPPPVPRMSTAAAAAGAGPTLTTLRAAVPPSETGGIPTGGTAGSSSSSNEPAGGAASPPPLRESGGVGAGAGIGTLGAAAVFEASVFPRASFWRRLGATFIDLILLLVLTGWSLPLGFVFWGIYFAGLWAWKETSIGGIVFGIRVVRLDGRPMDLPTAIVRSIATCLSVLACFIGYVWAAWDPQGQAWHDKIAGTVLVRAPDSQPLI